jgi:hypothetical protein
MIEDADKPVALINRPVYRSASIEPIGLVIDRGLQRGVKCRAEFGWCFRAAHARRNCAGRANLASACRLETGIALWSGTCS